MLKIANQVDVCEGFKGGLAVSDIEYMGTPSLTEKQHSEFLIYSNRKEMREATTELFSILYGKKQFLQNKG